MAGVHLNINGCVDSLELILQKFGRSIARFEFSGIEVFEVADNEHQGPVPQLECPKLKYLELGFCSLVGKDTGLSNLKNSVSLFIW